MLSEELESAFQAAERQALGDVNPNSAPQPAVVAPDASQVLLVCSVADSVQKAPDIVFLIWGLRSTR